MGPPTVSVVVVVVLGLSAALPGPTMGRAEGGRAPDEDTSTSRGPGCLLTRQDLIHAQLREVVDTMLNERDSPLKALDTRLGNQLSGLAMRLNDLSSRHTESDTRFNRMDSRLDGVETAIVELKGYVQARMEAMDRKMEWALSDTKPPQDGATRQKPKVPVYGGCQEALTHGETCSGVYTITPDCANPMDVYCEQRLDGGGWTVFQARHNGSVDFYQDWDAYKTGFGDLKGEFWLGNQNIHELTKYNDQQLKVELISPEGEVKYADFSQFSIQDETQKFRLSIAGYSGGTPPGDSMGGHNGFQFSTKDQDNDIWPQSCATAYLGAWWYSKCHGSNLNGQYGNKEYAKGLTWQKWKGYHVSMKATRMMIRKRP